MSYPGQYYDVETGKHYNYFRDYDPAIGRYIESDPIGLRAGLNTYAYVGGSPLLWSDQYGLASGSWIGKLWDGIRGTSGIDAGAQGVGEVLGAQCAKKCPRFRGTRNKTDVATEICFELQPGVQADPIAGGRVLKYCINKCLELISKACECVPK